MSAHDIGALRQFQSLPLNAKIRMTEKRIKSWFNHYDGLIYVSFSGGKDSTVLKHIVDSMYSDIPSVFVNTGLEYPEVRQFAMAQKNVVSLRPAMRFDEVIEKYGYPVVSKEQAQYIYQYRNAGSQKTKDYRWNGNGKGSYKISEKWKYLVDAPFKISDKCCNVMKKAPVKKYEKETGRKPILGTMCDEGILRLNTWLKYGCNAFEKTRPTSQPLSFWTEQDILQYIRLNDLEIAKVYGELKEREDGTLYLTGAQRTGCMFCMFGVQSETCPNRFQRMAETHPRQYDYCMKNLGLDEVLTFMKIDH